jgi:hypothetical protein
MNQTFEPLVLLAAHDLDLEVPAARRFSGMIRRLTSGRGAGVGSVQDRQRAFGKVEPPDDNIAVRYHDEVIAFQLPWLACSSSWARLGGPIFIHATGRFVAFLAVKPAGDMNGRLHVDVLAVIPQLPELDSLGMAQQPGGLMVQGVAAVFKATDPKGHPERSALSAHGLAGRGDGQERELAYFRALGYTCETIHKHRRGRMSGGNPSAKLMFREA